MAKLGISVSDWVFNEILKDLHNRSGKIEEYIIKGWMQEKREGENLEKIKSAFSSAGTDNLDTMLLPFYAKFPRFSQ